MATKVEVLACLDLLLAAYPNTQLPPETIRAYCEDLEDLDASVLQRACRRLRKTSKWFPAISMIRDEVGAVEDEANRAQINERNRRLLLDVPAAAPDDPRVIACKKRLRAITGGLDKRMRMQ